MTTSEISLHTTTLPQVTIFQRSHHFRKMYEIEIPSSVSKSLAKLVRVWNAENLVVSCENCIVCYNRGSHNNQPSKDATV